MVRSSGLAGSGTVGGVPVTRATLTSTRLPRRTWMPRQWTLATVPRSNGWRRTDRAPDDHHAVDRRALLTSTGSTHGMTYTSAQSR